jgi:hypothetical protein
MGANRVRSTTLIVLVTLLLIYPAQLLARDASERAREKPCSCITLPISWNGRRKPSPAKMPR